jgi:hypothetical protein
MNRKLIFLILFCVSCSSQDSEIMDDEIYFEKIENSSYKESFGNQLTLCSLAVGADSIFVANIISGPFFIEPSCHSYQYNIISFEIEVVNSLAGETLSENNIILPPGLDIPNRRPEDSFLFKIKKLKKDNFVLGLFKIISHPSQEDIYYSSHIPNHMNELSSDLKNLLESNSKECSSIYVETTESIENNLYPKENHCIE